ncbi:MAG: amino acid adenylation domain-containing protein [Arcobacter sp.]|nr:amino acid adenylation domain-containing protein [Arcobacter sp.]
MMKNGNFEFDYEVKIFYKLLFNGFKFLLKNSNLIVSPPNNLSDSQKSNARNFIAQNKDFIISTILENKGLKGILKFDIVPYGYKLSFAQERLWFIENYEGGTNAYNVPMFFKVNEEANVNALKKSIISIINKHDILRTVIVEDENGDTYQSVIELDKFETPWKVVDNKKQLDSELDKDANHIFNLRNQFPIKVCFYEVKKEKNYYLSIVIHHISFDGWSTDIFFKELAEYYSYYSQITEDTQLDDKLPKLSIQYRDFALWQRSYMSGEVLDRQLKYWQKELEDYTPLNLVLDNPRPPLIDYTGKDINFQLEENISADLRILAKELGVSLYSVLLSAFCITLRCYSNQDDIVIGTTTANRNYVGIEDLIGLFVNTLVFRSKIDSNDLVIDYIKQVSAKVIDNQFYQDLPFEKLVEKLEVTKDTNKHPIFQVMFDQTLEGNSYNKGFNKNIIEQYTPSNNIIDNYAKFDLTTTIDDSTHCIKINFNYATSIFEDNTISGYVDTYKLILNQFASIVKNTQYLKKIKLSEINYLNEIEYNKIIYEWNSLKQDYPRDKTISELFEEQVKKTPDSIAVIDDEGKISYSELNRRSNQLAAYIRKSGVVAGKLVGIGIDRSIDMIISILSVLKAGGGYIPIDPSHPKERFKYMLDISDSHILLTHSKFHKKVVGCARTIIEIDKIEGLDKYEVDNLGKLSTSKDISVVIFTSGTTGKPKGVMIEHRQKLHHIHLLIDQLGLSTKDKIAQTASQGFDISVWQMLAPLLVGGSTNIFSTSLIKDSEKFLKKIINQSITIVQLIPVYLDALLDIAALNPQYVSFNSLRYIIITGESASQDTCGKCFKIFNKPILNLYGPAECADDVTVYCMHDASDIRRKIPIGYPMANIQLYILNEVMQPVPIGCIGELYIGGECVSRGYINRPDLTAEKFVADIFTKEEKNRKCIGNRLYKTGDLARYFSNGNIEFLGRADSQVKIRGYRIELGEIETSIREYENISDCVAVAQEVELGDKRLIAYLIPKDKELFNKKALCKSSSDEEFYILSGNDNLKEEVKESLLKRLPEYMVPSYFVFLNKKPVTRNGKIDYKSLPSIESLIGKNESYLAPRNELEKEICVIWSEILGIAEEKIGINDNFFKLGGNSILAIKLVTKLNKHFKAQLSIVNLFTNQTIRYLTSRLNKTSRHYQEIIKLNNSSNEKNLFMIHPGAGGCEIYYSLAFKLIDNFSCYGIEPYNLYNESKIDNLNDLASLYISYINKINLKCFCDSYYLLGFSLGGTIALEMASILEKKGIFNIKIILIDTDLKSYNNNFADIAIKQQQDIENYIARAKLLNYDDVYLNRMISNINIENVLEKQKISYPLQHSKIVLFRATLDENGNKKTVNKQNTEQVLKGANLKTLDIKVNHEGIIKQESLLISEIINL